MPSLASHVVVDARNLSTNQRLLHRDPVSGGGGTVRMKEKARANFFN